MQLHESIPPRIPFLAFDGVECMVGHQLRLSIAVADIAHSRAWRVLRDNRP